eukprot:RCo042122
MEEVAEMNLDVITQKRSRFKEIADIQAFFGTMVSKLMEFRAYLPEAVLGSADTEKFLPPEHFDGGGTPRNNRRVAPVPSAVHASGCSSDVLAGATRHSLSTVENANTDGETRYAAPRKASSVNRQVGFLTHRTVSALQMDISGFHNLVQDEATLISTHSAVIQATSQVVHSNGGLSTPFAGDKVLAFWNVRPARSDHAARCVRAAQELLEA